MRIVPVLAVAVVAAAAACAPHGDDARDQREPDVIGTVTSVDDSGGAIAVGFAPDPGGEYFDGTTFEFARDGGLEDAQRGTAAASDVAVGDRLAVWVETCAESFPVQCPGPLGRLLGDRTPSAG
ncbi:hypothetical protein [Demequina soli]|uniref:hypothetical protein n=1 Tax=Demequina soli TaxID=1638987 RepID=UPI0007806A24|nr:hypothetical protein [Demequina soli]